MKNRIKFFGGIIIIILLMSTSFLEANPDVASTESVGQEKARKVWCQVLGDRQGCRNDNNRTCDDTVFCN